MQRILLPSVFVIAATIYSFSAAQPDPKWANLMPAKSVQYIAFSGAHEYWAFGDFDSIGNTPARKLAKRTEHGWQGLGARVYWKTIRATAADGQGRLFVSGECDKPGYSYCFTAWDGSDWRDVVLNQDARVNAMVADKAGNVYIGGAFTTVGGVEARSIAKWDGSTWSAVGTGLDSTVWAMAMSGNALLAACSHRSGVGSVFRLSKWDGSWNTVTQDSLRNYAGIALGPRGDLITSGYSFTAGAQPPILKKFSSGKWDSIGIDFDSQEGGGLLFDGEGTMWATGKFHDPDSVGYWCSGAKWDGRAWQRCVFPEEDRSTAYSPSGALAVVGQGGTYLWSKDGWQSIAGVPFFGGPSITPIRGFEKMARDASGNTYLTRDSLVYAYDGLGFRSLGTDLPGHASSLEANSKGELFAAGRYGANDSGFVLKWSGSAWTRLGNRTLVAPVEFMSIGPDDKIYIVTSILAERWDDTGWTDLGTAFNGADSKSIISFDKAGKPYKTDNGTILAKNDTGWSIPEFWAKPGVGQKYLASEIFFDRSGNAYIVVAEAPAAVTLADWHGFSILKWDGTALKEIGGFNTTGGATRLSSHVFDSKGNLYIGGLFNQVYTSTTAFVAVKAMAKWDGTAWTQLGAGIKHSLQRPNIGALAVDARDDIYVAGEFESADGVTCPNFSIYNEAGFLPQNPVRINPAVAASAKARVGVHAGLLRFQGLLPTDRILLYALDGKRLLSSAGRTEIRIPAASRQPLVVIVARGNSTLLSEIVMP